MLAGRVVEPALVLPELGRGGVAEAAALDGVARQLQSRAGHCGSCAGGCLEEAGAGVVAAGVRRRAPTWQAVAAAPADPSSALVPCCGGLGMLVVEVERPLQHLVLGTQEAVLMMKLMAQGVGLGGHVGAGRPVRGFLAGLCMHHRFLDA